MGMTFEEFQEDCLKTWNGGGSFEAQLFHAALGLGESGELQNVIKKIFFHDHGAEEFSKLQKELRGELGDVLYYPLIMAHILDFDIEEILQENCEKRHKRYESGYYGGTQE